MVTATSNIIECQNESEWLATRRQLGLGGSESSAALGQNKFCTRWKLYMIKTGQLPPEDETIPMMVGKALEDPIRQLASRELKTTVQNPGSYTIRRCPDHPHLFATLDGIVPNCYGVEELFGEAGLDLPGGDGIAQIKAVNAFAASDWKDGESWPLMYQIQTQHELLCSGLKWGVLPVLIGNSTFKMLPFVANERFQQTLAEQCAEFWRMVEERDPPPVDGSEATTEAIKKAFLEAEEDGETVALPAESMEWAECLEKAKEDKEDAESRERLYKNHLCAAIGEASYGMLPNGKRFSWKTQTRKSYVVEESTFRVLRSCK